MNQTILAEAAFTFHGLYSVVWQQEDINVSTQSDQNIAFHQII